MDYCLANGTACASQTVGPVNQLFNVFLQTLLTFQCSISPEEKWPRNYGPTAIRDGLGEYDFIIVGGGTAGCVLADRLTESGRWRVLVLEAGGIPPTESEIPGFASSLFGTKFDWAYTGRSRHACLAYVNGSCDFPAGKMLGGSHGMNGMLYLRGNDRDYDKWERMGNPTWNWETDLRYFKKSEGNQNRRFVSFNDGEYHSSRGKLIVDAFGAMDPFAKVILAGAKEAGYKYVKDLNAGKWIGYSQTQGTVYDGRRQSTAKTFLIPAAERSNLHVITNALVSEVQMKNDEAVGVRFTYDGTHEFVARSRKEVILSAGTIGSPQVLMLSGIGPRRHLEQLGIPVMKGLSVGKNFHDHAAVELFITFDSNDSKRKAFFESLDSLYELAVHNSGAFTGIGILSFSALLSTRRNAKYPDHQLQFILLRRGTSDINEFASDKMEPMKDALFEQSKKSDILLVIIALLTPKSRGRIKLKGQSISDKLDIDHNFLDHEEDVEILVRALKQQIALVKTRSYQAHGAKWLRLPLPDCDCVAEFESNEYYRCYVHHLCRPDFHPVGSCKIGPDTDPEAVVDYRLRVKGLKKLRIVDNSIIPVIPSANTMSAAIMIAERGADFIKTDWAV